MRTFVAVADAGQFSAAAADLSITQQAVSKRVAGLEQDLGVRLLEPYRPRRPAHRGRAGVPAPGPGPAAGRRAGLRRGPARPPRAAGRRGRPLPGPGRPAARLPPRPSGHRTRRGDAVRRGRGHRRGGGRHDRRVVPRRQPARAAAPGRHPGHPGLRRAGAAAYRAGPPVRRGRPGHPRPAGRAADLDARHRARHRVGRVLRRAGRRVRAEHRHPRAQLRPGAAARDDRQHTGTGHVRRRADPPHLAGRLRPAPHPGPRPGTGLPARPDLAPRQPASRPGRAARSPANHQDQPAQRQYVDSGLGPAGGGSWS